MDSIAEAMRARELERMRSMTPTERFEEALRLGQAAIESYASAHGVSHDAARRQLEKAANVGRRVLRSMQDKG